MYEKLLKLTNDYEGLFIFHCLLISVNSDKLGQPGNMAHVLKSSVNDVMVKMSPLLGV